LAIFPDDTVGQRGDALTSEPRSTRATSIRPFTVTLDPQRGDTQPMIRIACVCGKLVKVPLRYAGRSGQCPRCSEPLAFPSAYQAKLAYENELLGQALLILGLMTRQQLWRLGQRVSNGAQALDQMIERQRLLPPESFKKAKRWRRHKIRSHRELTAAAAQETSAARSR
jgi:hypothetical protein